MCALTGCAALLLNCKAKTVHSWAGIGLANGPIGKIVERVTSVKYKLRNWQTVDTLIIDEVSMMSMKLFELLDMIGRKARRNDKPFGGIQVIFSGDFYQLPPVPNIARDAEDDEEETRITSAFCFESELWARVFRYTVQLVTIFRQTDPVYTKILNGIRTGKLYQSSLDILSAHVGKPLVLASADQGLETFRPTILLPRRRDVDFINRTELEKLTSETMTYKASKVEGPAAYMTKFSPELRQIEYQYLLNNIMAEAEVVLKKGAQVMCVANLDMEEGIVNGSQGIIVDFSNGLPVVKFSNGLKRVIAHHVWPSETIPDLGVRQIPLMTAWAITIHKAQGGTLDMAQVDVGNGIFECGQSYVALSRIKSLNGLYLTALNPHKIMVNKKVQEFYKSLC